MLSCRIHFQRAAVVGFVALGLMIFVTSTAHAESDTPPGTGTELNPYLISELGHLVWIADTAASSAGQYYRMTADIEASETAGWNLGSGFLPIGTFKGVFDGDGHTIAGLTINRPHQSGIGLFDFIDTSGEVRNLGMVGSTFKGNYRVGGLAGTCKGTVSNCYATGAVTGYYYTGGLIGGVSYATVSNCYATCTVIGGSHNTGGLIGKTYDSTVSNCYATGAVTGHLLVGGLIGSQGIGVQTSNCYATGAVTADSYVGGLVGFQESGAQTSNCYATGAVTGISNVGGLAGFAKNIISNCYSIGAVTGITNVGGLVGLHWGPVSTNSYWDVETSGQSTSSAGTGKTTAEMMQQATFAGWYFAGIWDIDEGVSYPWLRSLVPASYNNLTVTIDGPGSVTNDPVSQDGTYAPGTVVTLTATPDGVDDEFARWVGAEPSDAPIATVVMDNHKSVTAMFRQNIEINTLAKLALIGTDPAYPLSNVHYTLTADIDASETAGWNFGSGFQPIGKSTDTSSSDIPFAGVFDGDGHTITGLTINRMNEIFIGLFGIVGTCGEVRNLGMVGGSVTGKQRVGGLAGTNAGTLSNCYTTSNVTGVGSPYCTAGGLVGINYGSVSNCYATGAIAGAGESVGGLMGANDGSVSNSYAAGAVSGNDAVGGLVGDNYGGAVTTSYATGAVMGADSAIGGLVGENNFGSALSNCYAIGAVTADSYVGGLVGYNEAVVSKCYSAGAVTGNYVVGGLVGYNYVEDGGTVSASYWDITTSGQSASDGGTGRSTILMKQQFTYGGWDFVEIWGIDIGVTYPYLLIPDEPSTPPVVTSAISVKTHGGAGEFGIDVLDRTYNNDIECRKYGVTTLVVGFDMDIAGVGGLNTSDVSLSSGSVDAVSLSASNELTIEMLGTTNCEPLTVTFPGIVNASDAGVLCTDAICIRQLVGDVYPDGVLTALDRVKVRDAMIQPVTASNFRYDVAADGVFTALDRVAVRDAMTTAFLGTCP